MLLELISFIWNLDNQVVEADEENEGGLTGHLSVYFKPKTTATKQQKGWNSDENHLNQPETVKTDRYQWK